jgi:hypothetical protein
MIGNRGIRRLYQRAGLTVEEYSDMVKLAQLTAIDAVDRGHGDWKLTTEYASESINCLRYFPRRRGGGGGGGGGGGTGAGGMIVALFISIVLILVGLYFVAYMTPMFGNITSPGGTVGTFLTLAEWVVPVIAIVALIVYGVTQLFKHHG